MSAAPQPGQRLAPWRHLVQQAHALAWTRVLADPNPIHYDAAEVARLGLGARPINQGPANIAYFYNMLAACFPEGETTVLTARMTGNVFVGDTVEVAGEVRAVVPAATGCVVHCALTLTTGEAAAPAALASAEVRLPREVAPAVGASPT